MAKKNKQSGFAGFLLAINVFRIDLLWWADLLALIYIIIFVFINVFDTVISPEAKWSIFRRLLNITAYYTLLCVAKLIYDNVRLIISTIRNKNGHK